MEQYQILLKHVLENGKERTDRTGTGTISVFGYQNRYDLRKGFPIVTTKKVHWKSVVHELLWFLKGDANAKYLRDNGITIWEEWTPENGDLGYVYPRMWRDFPVNDHEDLENVGRIKRTGIDQIETLLNQIQDNPDSRRLIVSAWHPAYVEKKWAALPPCHTLFQFYVQDGELSCQLYQRSADAFLGVPFNIASYALLTHMIAKVANLKVGEFVHTFGDLHIYKNHLEQVQEQLSREPRPLPELILPNYTALGFFEFKDCRLLGYDPHPAIKAPVAV